MRVNRKIKKIIAEILLSTAISISLLSCRAKSLEERGIKFNLVSFDSLEFVMGHEDRPVIISAYKISTETISADIYNKVMKTNFTDQDFNPSWFEAVEFCNKLNSLAGLKSCYTITEDQPGEKSVSCTFTEGGYRLATEAEWEAASSSSDFVKQEASEWCWDTFGTPSEKLQVNPTGIEGGSQKVTKNTSAPKERSPLQPSDKSKKCLFRICQSSANWGQDTGDKENDYYQKLYEIERQKIQPLIGMVKVQGGTFTMGNEEGTENPKHSVNLKDFEIGKTEVTVKLYKEIMGRQAGEFISGEDCPVDEISWYQAVIFCNLLSKRLGLTPCYKIEGSSDPEKWGDMPFTKKEETSYGDTEAASYMNIIGDTKKWNSISCDFSADGYRLPTEAEWEYAARGGSNHDDTKYCGGDNLQEAVICDNTWLHPFAPTCGQKKPNSLGIYDMSGSAWEWCWDWYANYTSQEQNNPSGPQNGSSRVRRGGSVFDQVDSTDFSVYTRSNYEPVYSSNSTWPFNKAGIFGFRLARSL